MSDADVVPPSHPTVARYAVESGELVVGGARLSRLAERVGSTPFFAYDRRLMTERVAELRAAMPRAIRLSYAVKANPMPAVVHHLSSLVDHLDVASAREMRVALDTGRDAASVSFAGPGKRVEELRSAVAAGVTIEVESETEADRVVALGRELGVLPRVAIRINPDFSVRGSGMRMGGGPQQFGVDAEVVPDLIDRLAGNDVDLVGFHVFAGSQNLHADVLTEAHRQTADLIVRLAALVPGGVRYVNLGGGLGIPYAPKDHPLDLAAVGRGLAEVVASTLEPALPGAAFVLELGRYLVGEAGVYVTRVVDIKVSRGHRFVVVDGGLHHQLAASGNFGSTIRRNYPLVVGTRMSPPGDIPTDVVGCLCTPLDLLGGKVELPDDVAIDDLVVVFQAGAYGLTASPTAFLGHPEPVEVLV
jgi:diaminopimelate decarboxylase